eukprot:1491301-Prymnesium_polylepis.1
MRASCPASSAACAESGPSDDDAPSPSTADGVVAVARGGSAASMSVCSRSVSRSFAALMTSAAVILPQ